MCIYKYIINLHRTHTYIMQIKTFVLDVINRNYSFDSTYIYIHTHTHTLFSHFFRHLFHCRSALWDWLLHESYMWLWLRLEQNWVSNAAFLLKALTCCLCRQLTRFWDMSKWRLALIRVDVHNDIITCSCRSRAGEPIPSRLQEEVWGSVWWRHHDAVHLPL